MPRMLLQLQRCLQQRMWLSQEQGRQCVRADVEAGRAAYLALPQRGQSDLDRMHQTGGPPQPIDSKFQQ